ncbi:MAG: hypothetical protein JWQ27_2220 [Ferruginibacter sp.]|nr:hypothetical protein [Ferruginibacter sp.]
MKKYYLLLSCLISITCFAQTEERIVASLDSFTLARPQEKAYVQTDKNVYLAGETIWLKAYVSLLDKPTILSRIVYVSIADAQGKILEKKMLKLLNGTASGDIDLNSDLPSGQYTIQGYTLWMRNFPDYLFSKTVTVFNNKPAVNNGKKELASSTPVVQFFPEGGNLVAGVNSTVAFQVQPSIAGKNFTGKIIDQHDQLVATLTTAHDGMGHFKFTPKAGEPYKAVMEFNPGIFTTVALPAVLDEGVVISADNAQPNKTYVKVLRGEKNKQAYNDLILVAQQQYKLVYMAKLNIDEGQDAVAINKKNLPAGIVQLTVLTASGVPLAERLVFVNNYADNSEFTGPANYGKRGLNSIVLSAPAFNNLEGAISIVNAETDSEAATQNILSSLLLTGDLKGQVINPAQYFIDKSAATTANLDLLMLVNGWRRFTWKDILQNKYSTLKYPFETSLAITGKVMGASGRNGLSNAHINMIIRGEDSSRVMAEAKLNSKSEFLVPDLDFKKAATVYYQATNDNKQQAMVSVTMNPAYVDTLRTSVGNITAAPFFATPAPGITLMLEKKAAEEKSAAKLLDAVVLKSVRRSPVDSVNNIYSTGLFEMSDQTLIMNEGNYFDIWQYIQGQVPGISINKADEGVQVSFNRFNNLDIFTGAPGDNNVRFFLNEVPVSVDIVDIVNPNDVAIVKVYKGATGIALGADRGAIAIYTKKGVSTRDWRDKGFDFVKRTGYSVSREFYEMNYGRLNPESNFTDVRTTLYWNPSVKISNGQATIRFYNDDITKKFKVTLEGMAADGQLLHLEQILK